MNTLRTASPSCRSLVVFAVAALLLVTVAAAFAGMAQPGPQYREYGAPAGMPAGGMPGMAPMDRSGAAAMKGMAPTSGNMVLRQTEDGTPPPSPVIRVKTTVRLDLVAKYPTETDADLRRYEATFEGRYLIQNKKKETATVQVFFPFPTTADTLPDVKVLVDGVDPEGVEYTQSGASWKVKFAPKENHEITVKYRAFGTEDFVYVLDHNERMGDLDFAATVTGAEHKPRLRPKDCLQPSTDLTRSGDTYTVAWKYPDLVTKRDLILEIPPPFMGNDVAKASYGLTWAGIATVMLFGLMLLCAGWASGKTVGGGQLALIALTLVMFYPLLYYLSKHMSVPLAFGISFVLSSLLVLDTLRRWQGLWFALRYGLFGLVTLLGLFSAAALATKGAGMLVMVGSVLLVWYAIRISPRLSERISEQLAAARAAAPPPGPPLSGGPVFRLDDAPWPGEGPETGSDEEGSEGSHEALAGGPAAPVVWAAAAPVVAAVEPETEEGQHFCAYCGGGVDDGFSFCPHCGKDARIAHECEHCGTQICRACAPGYRYCPGCGKALPEVGEG